MHLLVAAAVAVQAVGPQAAPAPAAHASSQERAELERLNAEWLRSYVSRDGSVLDRILADDFVATYANGNRRTKADIIKSATSPASRIIAVDTERVAVQVSGDVAVVTAHSVLRLRDEGAGETSIRNAYADVYVRRNGRWRAIAAHIVRLPST